MDTATGSGVPYGSDGSLKMVGKVKSHLDFAVGSSSDLGIGPDSFGVGPANSLPLLRDTIFTCSFPGALGISVSLGRVPMAYSFD